MKKLLSLILTLVLMCSLIPAAHAASDESTQAAQTLYELGLFRGTGTNADGTPIFDLDKTPTRNQAIIMLVRLLGKEEEALAGEWELPFTDVPKNSTAYPYIGYAYANGLTGGTSATTYSGGNPIRANQYITFVLRAMGYVSGEDFQVSTAWEFSDEIGLTDGTYSAVTKTFTRGDVAEITFSALTCTSKGSDETLFSMIQKNGAIPENTPYVGPQKLKWHYCEDEGETVHYEESYIQNATVAKVGGLYQFRLVLKAGCFRNIGVFPAGYNGDEDGESRHSKLVRLAEGETADYAMFLASEKFIFENPIHTKRMMLNLNPNLNLYPGGFGFLSGFENGSIAVKIETHTLPKT